MRGIGVAAALAVVMGVTMAAPVLAQDDALSRCRRISEPMPRLACYDAIPSGARAPMAAAPAAAAAPLAATPAAPPGAAADNRVEQFGLAGRPSGELQSIQSSVDARFSGWGPGTQIALANGQIWQVTDQSAGTIGPENRKVTIRRAAFGSFLLEFEGINNAPRVRRVR